jgi:malonyl-CoA decarboxylase
MPNMVSRGLTRVLDLLTGQAAKTITDLSEKNIDKLRAQLQECADSVGGEVSARLRAAHLAQTYLRLDDEGRRVFLKMIAEEFGPDPQLVAKAHHAYQEAMGTPAQWGAEAQLRAALRSVRLRILTQFNAMPSGVKFLVDLRADLLRLGQDDSALKALDRELEGRLAAWFDVGFLELKRITWESPALLLEKLVEYEAVHAIQSWQDLKNRLDSDRRCYAFFHPRMPLEPLIFVEVALVEGLADNVQKLLDLNAPLLDSAKANTAIFYSISATQPGLRGVSFGNFLLKRVVDDLKRDFPSLKTFATLSPIPRFSAWLSKHPERFEQTLLPSEIKKLRNHGFWVEPTEGDEQTPWLLQYPDWFEHEALCNLLREPFERLVADYLVNARRNGAPEDPVARFHLGNGARIERINWRADTSEKGMREAFGFMVNYLYDPDEIEANVESFAREGQVAAASQVRKLARR